MAKLIFYALSHIAITALLIPAYHPSYFIIIPTLLFILIGIYNTLSHHNILRNYPLIGYFRYLFEFIRPEIQQYFVATNLSGRPYPREIRSLIYARAKGDIQSHPFGTEHDITEPHFQYLSHSLSPCVPNAAAHRVLIGAAQCTQPYGASRINISGMSFGALSKHAVLAMNLGAKQGQFAQNTGEGGLNPYHLTHGADLIWQIGTGYFGIRTAEGEFDLDAFIEKAQHPAVKMIEIKLSQGAKPGHGGILPANKITPEIAATRGIPLGQDCVSPPAHSTFDSPEALLHWMALLRQHSGGKPVGFKLCLGKIDEFMGLCKAMLKTGQTPDFITIDGAEGGTGAAPLEFTNRLGQPLYRSLHAVNQCLIGCHLKDKITLIASGKIATAFDIIKAWALGADLINMARPMMFSIGCIQAMRCHTNDCPTGVATQSRQRQKAVVVKEKAQRVAQFQKATLSAAFELLGAMGIDEPSLLGPHHISQHIDHMNAVTLDTLLDKIPPGALTVSPPQIAPHLLAAWEASSAAHF